LKNLSLFPSATLSSFPLYITNISTAHFPRRMSNSAVAVQRYVVASLAPSQRIRTNPRTPMTRRQKQEDPRLESKANRSSLVKRGSVKMFSTSQLHG
jgi:hypothetical protein